jgi:hypothetical protein
VLSHIFFSASLPVCCAYALARGDTPERMIAALFFVAALATAATGLAEPLLGQTRWGVFAVDVALLIGLGAVALRANRIWPLWITSMQLFTVMAHIGNMIMPGVRPNAYRWSIILTSLVMVWALAHQTYLHRKRIAQTGAERSWSKF